MSYRNRLPDLELSDAIARSQDPAFFSHYFCGRKLHSGQEEWLNNSEATVNVLTTGNRYGKTSTLSIKHLRRNVLKLGAEPRYVFDGELDVQAFFAEKYKTIHTAGLWDTAKLVWEDVLQMNTENPRLRQLIDQPPPRTLPPEIRFFNGSRWLFRTLGDHGENIDGSSFYYISVDEAGWIRNLEEIMGNVLEVRVADVRGIIDLVGTMKPGLSRDFYAFARRAAIATGKKISFDHRDGRKYREEFPSAATA